MAESDIGFEVDGVTHRSEDSTVIIPSRTGNCLKEPKSLMRQIVVQKNECRIHGERLLERDFMLLEG